jgi:hypothetical protein
MGNKNNTLKTDRNITETQIIQNQQNYYKDLHSSILFRSEKREAALDYFNAFSESQSITRSHLSDSLSNKSIRSLGRRISLDILFHHNTKNLNSCISDTLKEDIHNISHEVLIDTENNTTSDMIVFKKTKTIKIDLRNEQPISISVIPRDKKGDIKSVNTDKMKNLNPQKYKIKIK